MAKAVDAKRMYEKGNHARTYTEVPTSDPGRAWREGMVSGNGENGYIMAGAPYTDTIIFQYMWFNFPSPDPRVIPEELTGQLADARRNVFNLNDQWKITHTDGETRKRTFFYSYHPGHQLRLNMTSKSTVADYERWTNYETAETGVRFTDEFGEWIRTSFTSREDNVSVMKIERSTTGVKINMTISIDDISSMYKAKDGMSEITALRYKKLVDPNADYIAQVAHYPSYPGSELIDGGYAGLTQVVVVNGSKKRVQLADTNEPMNVGVVQNPAIQVTCADAVYLITQSNRTFDMGKIEDFAGVTQYALVNELLKNTNATVEKYQDPSGHFDYDAALAPHIMKHAEEFNAVRFSLNGDEDLKGADNEALINAQKESKSRINHAFMEQVYNQGRYALICCSGSSAPRLYGMWTGEWNPGWRGIYTLDANVNLQVSPMNTGHLTFAQLGYIAFFLRNTSDFEYNARMSYGMHDALQVSVNSDGDRGMQVEYDNAYPFQYWNAGASWCLLPIFEYWQCYGNRQIPIHPNMRIHDLKQILSVKDGGLTDEEFRQLVGKGYLDLEKDILLPLLTKQANFWEQLCTPEYYTDLSGNACYEKGKMSLNPGEKYLLIPTYSPENNPIGYNSTITANATMDISAARDGLHMIIAIEKAIRREGYETAVAKWETLLGLLPDYKVDKDGALREWAMNEYKENNDHRHLSHLYPAWPAYETQNNEELHKAAIIAVENRNKYNRSDATAGHGWMHKALVCARLKDGDGVISSLLPMMVDSGYYTSLMTDHDTNRRNDCYCTDTLFGILGAVNEALLFSNIGEIEVLPALPTEWKSGSINGLMSRAGVEVKGLLWDNNIVSFTLQSVSDHNEIKVKAGIHWTKGMVNHKEAETHDDEFGKHLRLTLNAGEDVTVVFILS
ncbi:glycosyl hydrolase family 95 catalytic domain-containing protein [Halalkalibacterium halodurans]|uniref:glycosyl hydrolase family 95 catalytic domain-containing protein n=1 Tax=Halalkalibacterium halodurans TaxID=86665 RepID=UPI002AA98B00|nr:glycoside hydrolase N-terminal domain-containing protein [Halalkalibacterium halodurans]MDY7223282.1 glycoside hydrolase N-terminal domain-containing protein [Halalkalibacterium halodurans]MDY7242503.1 glycoside hydrolase N-terminal domain-containing protein [Halalkalibacterium halodurans]